MQKIVYDLTKCMDETSSSKGNLKKLSIAIDGVLYYIKTGRTKTREFMDSYGIEPIIECIVSQIADILHIPCVKYELCLARVVTNGVESVQLATISKDMRGRHQKLPIIYAEDLYTSGKLSTINYGTLQSVTSNREQLDRILLLDYIVCNEDRHNKNIAYINKVDRLFLLPAFDNGYSLLYSDIKGMRNDFKKAVVYCNCNAFYNSFDRALEYAAGSGRQLRVNVNFRDKTLENRLQQIYAESLELKKEYPNIIVPDRAWYSAVQHFIQWRMDTARAVMR